MAFDISMKTIPFLFATLSSISCVQTSNLDDETASASVRENPLVQSISYTKNQGSDTWRYTDTYDYEDNKITSRTETDVDSGEIRTYQYTYDSDLISNVQTYTSDGDLEFEMTIHYDSDQRVVSYNQLSYVHENDPTSWQASLLYDNDTIEHCDGQSWSSVEYKDVYEGVYQYTTNDNGDGIHRTLLDDCSYSATSTASNPDVIVDYDNHPSPFSNVKGNDFVLHSIIGIFSNSKAYGFHNNATKMTTSRNGTEEIQTWGVDYNEFHFPQSIHWELEGTPQESIDITYE